MRAPKATPTTDDGLRQFDHLDPAEAAARAWVEPGQHTTWHRRMVADVREKMPVLARALDRLADDQLNIG